MLSVARVLRSHATMRTRARNESPAGKSSDLVINHGESEARVRGDPTRPVTNCVTRDARKDNRGRDQRRLPPLAALSLVVSTVSGVGQSTTIFLPRLIFFSPQCFSRSLGNETKKSDLRDCLSIRGKEGLESLCRVNF